jgi:hypothetical protein
MSHTPVGLHGLLQGQIYLFAFTSIILQYSILSYNAVHLKRLKSTKNY